MRDLTHYIPIATTFIALGFASVILRRYWQRRSGPQLLWWGIGILLYGVGTATEASVTLFGWSGMGLGGYFGGLFFDLSSNYSLSFGAAAISGVINLLILMVLFHYTERKKSMPVLQPA